ncbi:MAG: transcriptional regulator [Alistipes sp.]|jgi:predicted transcriptional regulator|nr:transcriptional regulator [Alistipes sp.]
MEEKVLSALANGPRKAGEIATETGLAKADVDKAIKKLVAEGRVDSPKRCYYGIKA